MPSWLSAWPTSSTRISSSTREMAPARSRGAPTSVNPGTVRSTFERIFQKPMLIGGDIGHADSLEIIDRRAEPDRIGDGAGAGLEFLRRILEHALPEGHVLDHAAAALPWRHRFQLLGLAVENADAGRAEHLVAGQHVEIGAERLHVDRHVAHGLGAVDQHARAVAMRHLDHVARGRDGAERVGDMGEGDDARLRIEQCLIFVEQDVATVVDRGDAERGAFARRTASARARYSSDARDW